MTRRTPLAELERLVDEMQSRFGDAAGLSGRLAGTYAPSVDVVEYDDEYEVTVTLPGFAPEDVDVQVAGRTLTVAVEAESESETESDAATERGEGGRYLRRERRRAEATETVTFPTTVDADEVAAKLRNGLLTVTVPKADPARSGRRVEIE